MEWLFDSDYWVRKLLNPFQDLHGIYFVFVPVGFAGHLRDTKDFVLCVDRAKTSAESVIDTYDSLFFH